MKRKSSKIRIDIALEKDVPIILELIRALADYEKLSDAVVATEEQIRATLFGMHPDAHALLAWDGDRAVGFAVYFFNYSTFLARPGLYLEDLFVFPEERGRGIGKALLAHLAGIATDRGCGRLEWAVLDWNESAIAFYRSLGATSLDAWTIFRLTGEPLLRLAAQRK
jgi:GNAT superfamily N-acetyltransferase